MKKLILLIFFFLTFFLGFSISSADTQISSNYYMHIQSLGINSDFAYGVMNGTGRLQQLNGSGEVSQAPYYTYGSDDTTLYSNTWNKAIFTSENGEWTYLLFQNVSTATCSESILCKYKLLIYKIQNSTGNYGRYVIRTDTLGATIDGYHLKVLSLNNDLVFYFDTAHKYFTMKSGGDPWDEWTLMVSTENAPAFVNPITFIFPNGSYLQYTRQFVYGVGTNSILSCSMVANTYNSYVWSSNGLASNHQSLAIPPYNGSATAGNSCFLTYNAYTNVSAFSTFMGGTGLGYSQYYIPGQGFVANTVGKYIDHLYYSGGLFAKTVDLPDPDAVVNVHSFSTNQTNGIFPYIARYNLDYGIYAKAANQIFTSENVASTFNAPTLDGTSITTTSNNPINVSVTPNINNNVNITVTGSTASYTGLTTDEKGFWETTYNGLGNVIYGIGDTIGGAISGIGDSISNSINGLKDSLTGSGIIPEIDDKSGGDGWSSFSGSSSDGGGHSFTGTIGDGYNSIVEDTTNSGYCDMFDINGNFIYYSNGPGFSLTLNLSSYTSNQYLKDYVFIWADKLVNAVLSPFNNTLTVLRSFSTVNNNTNVCIFGYVKNIKYQGILTSGTNRLNIDGGYNFTPGKMTFYDYLALFVSGVIFLGFMAGIIGVGRGVGGGGGGLSFNFSNPEKNDSSFGK